MRLLLLTIFTTILFSCHYQEQDGLKLATEFHSNYASEFINNQELQKYSYNPRAQFYFLNNYETGTFRCLIRNSSNLRILNFGRFDEFQDEFDIELDTLIQFKRAELVKESGNLELTVNDSIPIKIVSIGKDPIYYFQQLKQLIEEYGIISYGQIRLGGIVSIIKVHLTAYDYMLYFPTDYQIKEKQIEEHWQNKQKSGRKLDENWYYYKSEQPLDFG